MASVSAAVRARAAQIRDQLVGGGVRGDIGADRRGGVAHGGGSWPSSVAAAA